MQLNLFIFMRFLPMLLRYVFLTKSSQVFSYWCWVQFVWVLGQTASYEQLIKNIVLQCVFHEFVDFHNCCLITTSITVVRGWEDSDDVSLMRPIVSVHDKLMGSWDKLEVVGMVELFWDILTERIACTSWWNTPSASIIWIRPQQIANWTNRKFWNENMLTLRGELLKLYLVI